MFSNKSVISLIDHNIIVSDLNKQVDADDPVLESFVGGGDQLYSAFGEGDAEGVIAGVGAFLLVEVGILVDDAAFCEAWKVAFLAED